VKLNQSHIRTEATARSSAHPFQLQWKWVGWAVKVIIAIAVAAFLYHRIIITNSELNWAMVFDRALPSGILTLASFFAILLMLMNWSIEVIKWKALMQTRTDIRWTTATKGVLSGVSFGVFSPNRTGEFIGRILSLRPELRVSGTVMSFVNGIAQTVATFTFGMLALFLLLSILGTDALGIATSVALRATLILTIVLLLFVYFRLPLLGPWLANIKWLHRWSSELAQISSISSALLRQLFHLSLLRFTTFIAQYMLLFSLVYESPRWLPLLGSSMLTLFSSTLVPFLPIPDLLVRESFALGYFELFSFDPLKVSAVVFGVWLINVALPAVIGTIILFTYRIFKRRG